jgi:hypothetical protein
MPRLSSEPNGGCLVSQRSVSIRPTSARFRIGGGMLLFMMLAGACVQTARSEQSASDGQADQPAGASRSASDNPADITIVNFVGQVERVAGGTGPAAVEVVGGARALIPDISTNGPLTVTGIERLRSTTCTVSNGSVRIAVNGVTYRLEDLPVLKISGPATLRVQGSGLLVGGDFGDLGTSELSLIGCQPVRVGAVTGDLDLNLAGSGIIQTGPISGDGRINLAGSGQATIGALGGELDLNVAGSGDTEVAAVSGRVSVNIAGSGNVDIGAGRNQADVNIAGSGDVRMAGTAIDPTVSIMGSGNVRVATIEGMPKVNRMGSGGLVVDRPD